MPLAHVVHSYPMLIFKTSVLHVYTCVHMCWTRCMFYRRCNPVTSCHDTGLKKKKRPWRWHSLISAAVSSLGRPAGAWAWSTCATMTRPPCSLTVSFATSGCTTSTTGSGRRITTGRTWGSQVTVNWRFGLKTIIILRRVWSKVSMRLKHQI